jgi:Uncharacterized protein conserved in bacteria
MNQDSNFKYLNLLSKHYSSIDEACTEIINLSAILHLPKGTEHFLSDIHGEFEAFSHVLRNASGVIKKNITDLYANTLEEKDINSLATLIYYPEQKLEVIKNSETDITNWYKITLLRLIEICKYSSSKYTRSKVRKMLPKEFAYIIEELLHEQVGQTDKIAYYKAIVDTIVEMDKAYDFIIEMSKLIQKLVIDRLHIIGDIYDRGPAADKVLDLLMNYHSVDVQWGNHDILWMGASRGQSACVATVIRICIRYNNLEILEDGYGINLLPLATFAMRNYESDKCMGFMPKISDNTQMEDHEIRMLSQMHKAISIIQFKLEGQLIRHYPEFCMENRDLFNRIDWEKHRIDIDGDFYQLNEEDFPTVDTTEPLKLTEEEHEVIERLSESFMNSERLQRHMNFLLSKGSMYLIYNSNLLYHGCIPMDKEGEFAQYYSHIEKKEFKGKELLEYFEHIVRRSFHHDSSDEKGKELLAVVWYLWAGPLSPLFGKNKMTTFERYFINDTNAHIEEKNSYFQLVKDENICKKIFEEFLMESEKSHIINGHVPVITKTGESPIKANGRLLVIDGGFSRAYQKKTGIAGYTLINSSYGMSLVSHSPFESVEKAVIEEKDIVSTLMVVENEWNRILVKGTDIGTELTVSIKDLMLLVEAYKNGLIQTSCNKPIK